MGRPRKEIDFEQFKKLCALQCTLQEIAEYQDKLVLYERSEDGAED